MTIAMTATRSNQILLSFQLFFALGNSAHDGQWTGEWLRLMLLTTAPSHSSLVRRTSSMIASYLSTTSNQKQAMLENGFLTTKHKAGARNRANNAESPSFSAFAIRVVESLSMW
jgi:hypothetical protein